MDPRYSHYSTLQNLNTAFEVVICILDRIASLISNAIDGALEIPAAHMIEVTNSISAHFYRCLFLLLFCFGSISVLKKKRHLADVGSNGTRFLVTSWLRH